MIGKMPGTREEQFANLRAYYGFMWAHPGKKLLFMGRSSDSGPSGTMRFRSTGARSRIRPTRACSGWCAI